jgi:MFS transporter, DHA2 family, glioxin efflux transporter
MLAFLFQTPANATPAPLPMRDLLFTFDIPSIIVLMGSLICFLLALEWGGITKPWNSTNVVGTLSGFFLLAILWVFIQWKQEERAMVVGRIIKQRTIGVCAAFILWSVITPKYILGITDFI